MRNDQYAAEWKNGTAPQRVLLFTVGNGLTQTMELRGNGIWHVDDQSGDLIRQINHRDAKAADRAMSQHKAQLTDAGIYVIDYEVAFGHCIAKQEAGGRNVDADLAKLRSLDVAALRFDKTWNLNDHRKINSIDIYWDDQDPTNVGWAYRAKDENNDTIDSGPIDLVMLHLDDDEQVFLDDAICEACYLLDMAGFGCGDLTPEDFAREPNRDGGFASWSEPHPSAI